MNRRRVLLLLVLIGVATFQACADVAANSGCPPLETILPCRCLLRGEEFQIWCSHSDLPRVLDGLRAVGQHISQPIDELILENNYLPALPGRTFLPLRVMRLMLRYNGLERVSSDWLAGLGDTLMELFIVEPELRTLPDDSLLHMNALEAITVQTDSMKRLPFISRLPKLRYVQIESASLLELAPLNFRDNPRLQKLHVTKSPRLTRLEANVLRDLPNLNLVNISFCGISWIHPRAFGNLPSLKELSLTGNKITDAGMVGRGTRDLPELEVIKLDNNYIDKIGEATFVDLPALKKLYLADNEITELHHGAFHRVPSLRSLDMNRNSLRRVHPESFLQHSGSGLEELWLVDNDISHVAELRSLLDALPRLTFLDMSHNNLEAIPFGALRGHPTLEYLHLDYNKIHLIDREAFMAMPALRELRLKNNSLSDMLQQGPLWNLPALKGLDISGNYFRRMESDFLANLPALRRIDLSSNELTYIDPQFFTLTPELEHVNLSFNSLAALHPATFRHLLNLYELDVSHNRLLEFVPGLPRGIEYLHMSDNQITGLPLQPSPDLDLPSLRLLDLADNRIQRLPKGSLRTMPQLRRLYLSGNLMQELQEFALEGSNRLEFLDLHGNRILEIHPNALKEIVELRELNLSDNRLDILIPEVFKAAPRLKKLDVSKNQLSEILPGTFDQNRELQSVDASHNALVQLSTTFFGLKHLQQLDVTDNRLKHIDPEILSSLTSLRELRASKNFVGELKQGAFNNLQHLRVLHLDNNELEFIEPNAIRSLPLLKSIRLNRNKLKEIPNNAFTNLPLLQIAELQENQLRIMGPNVFNVVPHLLMLNLSHNQFGSIEDAGLRSLRSLEMLDLSKNRINRVAAGNDLERMEWLVELRMDDNNICGVQGSFNGMPRLRVLTMRNNKMMSFPEQAIDKLRGNIAVLDIDGNPLVCSCNMIWLQGWLRESLSSSSSTTNARGPKCVDGSLLREMRLSREQCDDENGRRSNEIVAPGCEAELLSAPGNYGTSQVFSQWMKLTSNTTTRVKNTLAPTPEESEYFYDEYVDYPYNETETNGLGGGRVKQHLSMRTTSTTASPHIVAGDTPTIYAASGQRTNKTRPDIPKEVVNSPSTSGFTFFGVPLPALNFNHLLNGNKGSNGRMEAKKMLPPLQSVQAQRKTAIVNNPMINGRTGMHFTELTKMKPPSPVPVMPPDFPEIQTGGFKPILPGSGGFLPIVNPSLMPPKKNETKLKVESTTLKSLESIIEISTVEPVKSVLMTRKGEDDVQSVQSIQSITAVPSTDFPVEMDNTSQQSKVNQEQLSLENIEILEAATVQEVPKEPAPTEQSLDVKDLETPAPTNEPPKDEPEIITTDNPPTILPATISTTSTTTHKTDTEQTPLQALLVPGGQQPQFRPPAGRSTITKVASPHAASASAPLQSNFEIAQLSEPLKNNREGKNRHTPMAEDLVSENETSWYFANYNKSSTSEPYNAQIQMDVAQYSCVETVKVAWPMKFLLIWLTIFVQFRL